MLSLDQRTDSPFSPASFPHSSCLRSRPCFFALTSPGSRPASAASGLESPGFGEVPAGWDPGRVASCVPGKAETLRPCTPSAAKLAQRWRGALGTSVD